MTRIRANRIAAGMTTRLGAATLAMLSGPVAAQTIVDKDRALTTPPTIYGELVACRTVEEPAARLACFDEKVAAFETAKANNELVIADREQVREARRGLFGLSLPRISLFDGDADEGERIEEVESTVAGVRSLRDGKYLIQLEDGAIWQQTDGRGTMRQPKPGDTIVIKRALMGSFLAKVNDGRGFKVKRLAN